MPEGPVPLTLAVDNPAHTVDKLIQDYVALRDKKKAIQERHQQELLPFNSMMARVEGYMLEALNRAGIESMRGKHGTIYKSMRTSAVVRDWPLTLAFIKAHDAWHMLEARVAKNAAFEVIKETGEPIPGVETSAEVTVNVRRAGEKPERGDSPRAATNGTQE